MFEVFFKTARARTRTHRGPPAWPQIANNALLRQDCRHHDRAGRFAGTLKLDFKPSAKFNESNFDAELRNRLVAKRCGCSEEVLILRTIFEWEVRHHARFYVPFCL